MTTFSRDPQRATYAGTLGIRVLIASLLAVFGLCLAAEAASAAGPTAVATDSDGVVYTGFASGGTISRYAGADGQQLTGWGTPGSAAGQLGGIVAIDVAPSTSGNVWILDTNLRIQEFTRSGTYVRGVQLGACQSGLTPDPLARGGLDVTSNAIYVAHPCKDEVLRIRKSDLVTTKSVTIAGAKGVSAQLYDTAPASTQRLYVARPGAGEVLALGLDDLATKETKSITGSPSDVFVDAYGVLTVSETATDQIHLYGSDGSEFRTLGRTGTDAGSLNRPVAIDVFEQFSDLAGNIFIADYGNNRLQRWNPYGFTFWTAAADGGASGPQAPLNTTRPAISGNAAVGQQLSCSNGTWSNSPTGYAQRWSRDGSPISGATSSTYTVAAADSGHALTCIVTATNGTGSADATSDPVTPAAAPQAPANTARPAITGSASPGGTLTCSNGTWSNNPASYSYAWKRDGSTVGSGSTYAVTASDVGHAITCEVTATNATGSGTATSDPVTPTAGSTGGGGTVGVSIAAGATYTNSPGVTLTIHEPQGATSVTIANDGGFAGAQTVAVRGDDTYTWTLATSGSERLPKTVYVRFTGAGDPNQTFTDDIILDQTAPAVRSARISGKTLKVAASDEGSGVATLEIAKSRAGTYVTHPYAKRTKVSAKRARFVRAVDGAGNVGVTVKVKR